MSLGLLKKPFRKSRKKAGVFFMERFLVLEGLFAERPLYPSFHWSLSRFQGQRASKRFASGSSQGRRTTLKRSPSAPEMPPNSPKNYLWPCAWLSLSCSFGQGARSTWGPPLQVATVRLESNSSRTRHPQVFDQTPFFKGFFGLT